MPPVYTEVVRLLLLVCLCRLTLAADSYFPLQVGNRWVYRVSDRQSTSRYIVWRVVRAESIEGTPWFVVAQTPAESQEPGAGETRYRSDPEGRIYRLNFQGIEELWLDPTEPPSSPGLLATPLGEFPNTLSYSRTQTLSLERGTLASGVGLVRSQTYMLSGSSGGFLQSLDLVEARLGPGILLTTGSDGLELSVERTDLDITGGQVTNCAVPCYFVACGFAPGADPPNTYKPCFQVRLRWRDFSLVGTEPSTRTVELDLVNSSGDPIFRSTQKVPVGGQEVEATVVRQIRLYTVPNEPVPPGTYQVRARADTRSAVVNVQVR